jgi:hypothetical protein
MSRPHHYISSTALSRAHLSYSQHLLQQFGAIRALVGTQAILGARLFCLTSALSVGYRPWSGRLAQRESAAFTRQRSLVQSQYRPPPYKKYCLNITCLSSRRLACFAPAKSNTSAYRIVAKSKILHLLGIIDISAIDYHQL